MEKRVLIALAIAAMILQQTHAQNDDFGVWGELGVEKKIDKHWSVGADAEFRSRDHVSEADRWSGGVSASYKINKWLKVGAGYTLLYDHNERERNSVELTQKKQYPKVEYRYADYWGTRHRFNVSLTLSHDFGNLSVSLRERWQYSYRPKVTTARDYKDYEYRYSGISQDGKDALQTLISAGQCTQAYLEELRNQRLIYLAEEEEGIADHTYSAKGKNVWRNRLQLKYKVNKMWRPYVSAETNVSHGLEKIRYAAGTEVRLTKQHWLDVKYLYQDTHNDDDNEGNRHVIGIGYTYKF